MIIVSIIKNQKSDTDHRQTPQKISTDAVCAVCAKHSSTKRVKQSKQVAQLLLGLADRSAHSRRSVQKLLCIHLAMLIYRDRGVKVKIRISVRV